MPRVDHNVWGRAVAVALRRLRQERNMTQKAVGERIGMDRNYVSDLENAERDLQISTFGRIAEALEITPTEFMAAVEKENERLTRRRRK